MRITSRLRHGEAEERGLEARVGLRGQRRDPPADRAARHALRRVLHHLLHQVGLGVDPERDRAHAGLPPAGISPALDTENPEAAPPVDRLEAVGARFLGGLHRAGEPGLAVQERRNQDRDPGRAVGAALERVHLLAAVRRVGLVRRGLVVPGLQLSVLHPEHVVLGQRHTMSVLVLRHHGPELDEQISRVAGEEGPEGGAVGEPGCLVQHGAAVGVGGQRRVRRAGLREDVLRIERRRRMRARTGRCRGGGHEQANRCEQGRLHGEPPSGNQGRTS